MFDEQHLREKVQQLENEAITIEQEMEHFFSAAQKPRTPQKISQPPTTLFPPLSSFSDYEKFLIITGELAIKHRSLIRHYEIWYHQAHILIQNYYKEKETDFVRLHDGVRETYTGPAFKTGAGTVTKKITAFYGISELLQFSPSVQYSISSACEIIQNVTGLFSNQRAILLSLPEILPYCIQKKTVNTHFSDDIQVTDTLSRFPYQFEIALSFPGEYRDTIRIIADRLVTKLGKDRIFYDKYYEGELARLNLDDTLQEIYRKRSKLIVVFFCSEYEKKEWCGLEWRAIKDLIISRKGDAIMPVKLEEFDITGLTGLFSYDGYLDIRGRDPTEVVQLIIKRYNSMGNSKEPSIVTPENKPNPIVDFAIDSKYDASKELVIEDDLVIEEDEENFITDTILSIQGIVRNVSEFNYDVSIIADVYSIEKVKIGSGRCSANLDPYGKSRFQIEISTINSNEFDHYRIHIGDVYIIEK